MVKHTALWYYKNDSDVKTAIKQEFPNYDETEIKKELKKRWKSMNDEQKEPYTRRVQEHEQVSVDLDYEEVPNQLSQEELVPENIEDSVSNKPDEDKLDGEKLEEDKLDGDKLEEDKLDGEKLDGDKIPEGMKKKKAKSSFMHYIYDPVIRNAHSEYKGNKLVSHLSSKWRDMTDEEKQPWIDKANKEKEELLKHPQYIVSRKKSVSNEQKNSDIETRVELLSQEINTLITTLNSLKKSIN